MTLDGIGSLVVAFFTRGGALVVAIVTVVVLLSYRWVARRLQTTELLAAVTLLALGAILAVTIGVRMLEGGVGFGVPSLVCIEAGDCLDRVVRIDAAWIINVALFVPAGVAFTVITGRWQVALIGLVALSLLIELTQGVLRLGSPDPGDLVTNSIGAALGVALGFLGVRAAADGGGERHRSRLVVLSVGAVAAAAVIFWLGASAGASARADAIAEDVRATLGAWSAPDVGAALDSPDGAHALFFGTEVVPDYVGEIGQTGVYEARYSTQFLGILRCVFARWDETGLTLETDDGDRCTVFAVAPPG